MLAQVVKPVDTLASGANARKSLRVRISPWARLFNYVNCGFSPRTVHSLGVELVAPKHNVFPF